jgi:anti-sigma factor RsiW
MSTTDLTCKELVELVTDYLEGRLAPEGRERFERHLELCPGCATYLEQFRDTIALTGALREDDVPLRARDELLAQFRNWKESSA